MGVGGGDPRPKKYKKKKERKCHKTAKGRARRGDVAGRCPLLAADGPHGGAPAAACGERRWVGRDRGGGGFSPARSSESWDARRPRHRSPAAAPALTKCMYVCMYVLYIHTANVRTLFHRTYPPRQAIPSHPLTPTEIAISHSALSSGRQSSPSSPPPPPSRPQPPPSYRLCLTSAFPPVPPSPPPYPNLFPTSV